MKKIISIFAVAAACTMLLTSCSSEEGPSELDLLIEQLQTTHLNTGSPEDSAENEPENPYKSITGIVVSFGETDITIKSNDDEQKFIINKETQILGGVPSASKAVTITYCEPEKKSKGIIANIITMIDPEEKSTVDATDTLTSDSTISETSTGSVYESETETAIETPTETAVNSITETAAESETEATVESVTTTPTEVETEATSETENEVNSESQQNEQSTVQTETQADS